jgi:3-mercaptopyruvate sulfurtransferase SseA
MQKKKRRGLLPIILFAAVVGLSITALLLANNLRQAKIEYPTEVTSQDEVPRVTAQEAYQAQTSGEAEIIDTRSKTQYEQEHIAGSINIPLDQLENRMDELDPGTWYITYCT